MASSSETNKLRSSLAIKAYDFDPDGTNAVDVAWVDMRDYEVILIGFFRTIGTGALDTFSLLGNSESDGSGTDVTVKAHAVASEPNATGDQIWLEISAQEIQEQARAAGVDDVRYVTASAEFATGTDEGVVMYIRGETKHAVSGLTADIIS